MNELAYEMFYKAIAQHFYFADKDVFKQAEEVCACLDSIYRGQCIFQSSIVVAGCDTNVGLKSQTLTHQLADMFALSPDSPDIETDVLGYAEYLYQEFETYRRLLQDVRQFLACETDQYILGALCEAKQVGSRTCSDVGCYADGFSLALGAQSSCTVHIAAEPTIDADELRYCISEFVSAIRIYFRDLQGYLAYQQVFGSRLADTSNALDCLSVYYQQIGHVDKMLCKFAIIDRQLASMLGVCGQIAFFACRCFNTYMQRVFEGFQTRLVAVAARLFNLERNISLAAKRTMIPAYNAAQRESVALLAASALQCRVMYLESCIYQIRAVAHAPHGVDVVACVVSLVERQYSTILATTSYYYDVETQTSVYQYQNGTYTSCDAEPNLEAAALVMQRENVCKTCVYQYYNLLCNKLESVTYFAESAIFVVYERIQRLDICVERYLFVESRKTTIRRLQTQIYQLVTENQRLEAKLGDAHKQLLRQRSYAFSTREKQLNDENIVLKAELGALYDTVQRLQKSKVKLYENLPDALVSENRKLRGYLNKLLDVGIDAYRALLQADILAQMRACTGIRSDVDLLAAVRARF